jgi:hypothetical protein
LTVPAYETHCWKWHSAPETTTKDCYYGYGFFVAQASDLSNYDLFLLVEDHSINILTLKEGFCFFLAFSEVHPDEFR